MTNNTATQSLTAKPLLFTGTGVLALALLTGCSTAADDPATTPAPEQATTSAPAEAESTTPATDESGTPADEQQPNAGGNDPVFDAIAAVTAEHGDGFIVSIDRDDRDEHYEIDVVVGEQVLDLKVGLDGTITEDEQDSDDDDIQKAQQATVDAETALKRAFESRAEGLTVDDVELDEDDDRLVWEIDFDDADGKDSDEVVIDAQDGSVVRDSAA
ncbi:PepSY domain-containing protein [Micrococcus terreus]|uniref:PepSY domain-containing protein n=1 Tax=Micrococcus terreus TaxID=574650 RepID=UPI00254E5F51|nr:PepSY domain-containing protein [Micrococcus terreus]MDK7701195.1 PepSY domain-containing protein [Micrococcus terreus]WOO97796.1 PepSY domain-containing protein [Micrococcus terreus]